MWVESYISKFLFLSVTQALLQSERDTALRVIFHFIKIFVCSASLSFKVLFKSDMKKTSCGAKPFASYGGAKHSQGF